MTQSAEYVIIGAGSAGLAALRQLQKAGKEVLLISESWGTTCARVGCMPSKALIESANAFHRVKAFPELGLIGGDHVKPDIPKILAHVRALRDDFAASPAKIRDKLGDQAITGRATLVSPQLIEVGDQQIQAQKIILAVGSSPTVPKPWWEFGDLVLTTDDFFELDDLPSRMGVVGLGAIGVELALAMGRLGIEVTGVDAGDTIAGISDPEILKTALMMTRNHISLHLESEAKLSSHADGIKIATGDREIVVDKVLAAIGRKPNIDKLGLEHLGVALNDKGMPDLDRGQLQIGDLPIWMAGDGNGILPLLHEASDEGYIAATHAMADQPEWVCRRAALGIVFSHPDIARIGKGFDDLAPDEYVIGMVDFAKQGRARIAARNFGQIRIYADAKDATILGAELCAPSGEHLAQLLALAIERNMTLRDVLAMPFYHPTLEEGLRTALRDAARQLPDHQGSDLSACEALGLAALE